MSERLEQKLEDDYLLWYDVPVGGNRLQPDFIILHPRRGVLVLEVKDWRRDTIVTADRTQFRLRTGRGLVHASNPVVQARGYATAIADALRRDPALRNPADHPYAGQLAMPWGFGAVFANITRRQFDDGHLGEVIPEHLVICQDEMVESVDAEAFQERLWAMFGHIFPVTLTLPQLDRVRWHLYPELRVEPGSGQFGLFDEDQPGAAAVEPPDIVKVMDMQQELLARSLGDEHRLIHGVAGSGKTMILGYRALHLARALHKPILVLCYNRALAARLEQLVAAHGLANRVQVYNFHRWCRHMLVSYHQPLPADGPGFSDGLPVAVMDGVDRERIPRAQYGAVLIDEGHDFEPDWYRLVVQMIDPNTNSLLVLYDDAQNIYGKGTRLAFSWKSVGIQAQGRTTILRINYRNTMEILAVSAAFARELLVERPDGDDGVPLIAPESAGRRGPLPVLLRAEYRSGVEQIIFGQLRDAHEHGRPWRDMAVICRQRWEMNKLRNALERQGIPCQMPGTGRGSGGEPVDAVSLVTMHASKGLEFALVILVGVDAMPAENLDEGEEARLLYVAMTRAMERLLVVHWQDSVFTRRTREAIDTVQRQLEKGAEPIEPTSLTAS